MKRAAAASKQMDLVATYRAGDVVRAALGGVSEVICVGPSSSWVLIAPWPASIRKRRSERRVEARDLVLERGCTDAEHRRALSTFAMHAADFEPADRDAFLAALGASGAR